MQTDEFYSTEFNEIIRKGCVCVIGWGWGIIVSLLGVIVIGCWIIRYPDVVVCQITLKQDTTPAGCSGMMLLSPEEDSLFVPGQSIQVKLSQYSYLIYGTIGGCIAESHFNSDIRKQVVMIDFPQGLYTSAGRYLLYEEGLSGYCEVVIRTERLIKKIFPSLLKKCGKIEEHE